MQRRGLYAYQLDWLEAVNESVLLMLCPQGFGLKLGPLPAGHCMMVVFWTLVEKTESHTECMLCPMCPVKT